jgi:hypothetical protein
MLWLTLLKTARSMLCHAFGSKMTAACGLHIEMNAWLMQRKSVKSLKIPGCSTLFECSIHLVREKFGLCYLLTKVN